MGIVFLNEGIFREKGSRSEKKKPMIEQNGSFRELKKLSFFKNERKKTLNRSK